MNVIHLTPPGRFPTVVHDPGLWWDRVCDRHTAVRFSVNYHWWRVLCSPQMLQALLSPLPLLTRWHCKLTWAAKGVDAGALARAAGRTLDALTSSRTYQSRDSYFQALAPLAEFLHTLNALQPQLSVTIDAGPQIKALDYCDSKALAAYARTDSFLSRTMERALESFPRDADFAAISVTSPADLLTALIACRILRARSPRLHLCLADHGYENFSLHTQTETLKASGIFDEFFDSIIVSKDDRDDVLPGLVDALARGQTLPRYLTLADLPAAAAEQSPVAHRAPLAPSFSPEPIFWTRLSKRRCYWSRCTYCAQNGKYADPRAPTRSEILRTLDRLQALVAQGCRHFIFSDEALSPSTLRVLAQEIQARNLKFHWACRCKLERAHDAELFEMLGRAGCYEILYGLETISDRVLKLMDKHVEGLDEDRIAAVFREMQASGISVHVNLIGGYPGDTVEDARRTAQFITDQLASLRNATYIFNVFGVLQDTPVARTPQQYGIASVWAPGDLAQDLDFELSPDIAQSTAAAAREVLVLRDWMDEVLGWRSIAPMPLRGLAQGLYFGSGHGSIFKAGGNNPFANPLFETGNGP